ncbi:hypothetical protein BN946_scf184858.g8 [Trametes cinnabarina]|uniref:BTB domain-containing protein n=1 Tax=Pycnoporus cinnabarinus TaxID=5643 RepID=A0A060SSX2_PYCCI|nr:hypothetical protein BN946_scf184858.g8 [Trametes cinnabarina]
MLSSSLNRPTHHRPQPSISGPMPAVLPAPGSSRSKSPSTSPRPKPKSRRPSVSSPMTWLSRASSSSSVQSNTPYAPSKPVRISEPRFMDPIEALTLPRGGVLGAGAIVVRTPQDALAGPRASASTPDLTRTRSASPQRATVREYEDRTDYERPSSPPLPPIPDDDSEYEEEAQDAEPESVTSDWHSASQPVTSHPPPPPPSRPPPSIPSIPDYDSEVAPAPPRPVSPLRPSPKAYPPTPTPDHFAVPTVPAGVPALPPQPPFDAILVSPVPNSTLDPSKIIVSLETSTATNKTTMATLVSRPSYMASFLLGLFPSNDADTQSVYSNNSDVESSFNSIFQHHLASSGVLTQTSTNLHVFLDRPSAPYAHILAYLRSPHSTPETPASLPHAARLNGSPARVEALIELRDEAAYLGLDELERLCNDELRHARQGTPSSLGLGLHMRGFSSASTHSVRSLHTLRERAEPIERGIDKAVLRRSDDSGFASAETAEGARKSGSSAELEVPWPSPPELKQRAALKEKSPKKAGFASLKARPAVEWI